MDQIAFEYIDTETALNDWCVHLSSAPWLAVDTEFVREKTYFPKLCLLQVATQDSVACIDPLVLDNIDPVLSLIYEANTTKVLHAARQDLEIFYQLRDKTPSTVFDTQIAAPLLGFDEQIGYARLVKAMLGVELDKSQTRADWMRRPIPTKQLTYAANDVKYLAQLYPMMREQLQDLGRLAWLDHEFVALTEAGLYNHLPQQAWRKVSGVNKLNKKPLAIVQALAAWRELAAKTENRPRSWLIKDDGLIDIARLQPSTLDELKGIRSLQDKSIRHYGEKILSICQTAPLTSIDALIKPPKANAITPAQEVIVDALLAVVRLRGLQHSLHPNIIATRKEVEKLVSGDTNSALTCGWRKALVGEELVAVLAGQRRLLIIDGELVVEAI